MDLPVAGAEPVQDRPAQIAENQSDARRLRWPAEPIGEKLRTIARLGGWPILFASGNWWAETSVNLARYNWLLGISFLFVILTQLVFTVRLEARGINWFPPLSDAAILFGLSSLSGGIFSPISNTYLLFIIVHAVGLHVRGALAISAIYALSYALLEALDANGLAINSSEGRMIFRQASYLFWTALTAGILAQVLRAASERASLSAQENALLFERAERTGSELRSVLNSTINGIFLVGKDLRVRFVNRQMGALLGIDLSDSVGRHMPTLLRERLKPLVTDPEAFEARLLGLYGDFDQEATDEIEIGGAAPRLLSRYSGPVRDESGNLLGRIEVYRDITEERAADRLKDEFLSLAAHELKTPITSLKAYAQLLRRKPVDEIPPQLVKNALDTIDRQATQLTVLVNDLLDVSRVETGHLDLRLQPLDLSELMCNVARQLATTSTEHVVEVLPSKPVMVCADPSRIEQVAVNLLTNALKYSPDGGRIAVSVQGRDGEAVASFADEGIGIPPDKLPHIFDRFYQAHATATYSYGGMGIGLYISREIISRHGGNIWVQSEEGKGSTFSFSLPMGVDSGDEKPGPGCG